MINDNIIVWEKTLQFWIWEAKRKKQNNLKEKKKKIENNPQMEMEKWDEWKMKKKNMK